MIQYDSYHINRCDALEFLHAEVGFWPDCVPAGGPTKEIGESLFHGWCFILLEDGELVFADCLSPCIRKSDFEEYCAHYAFN